MKRGEIYWADLAPRSGSEQTGRRPVILVSHDGFNQTPSWKSIIVVPISTSASQGKRAAELAGNGHFHMLQGLGHVSCELHKPDVVNAKIREIISLHASGK